MKLSRPQDEGRECRQGSWCCLAQPQAGDSHSRPQALSQVPQGDTEVGKTEVPGLGWSTAMLEKKVHDTRPTPLGYGRGQTAPVKANCGPVLERLSAMLRALR